MKTFKGLTKRGEQIFSLIAIGRDDGHNDKAIKALQAKGLIESYEEILPGRFPIRIKRYFVPTAVHIEWCEWCAAHPIDEAD